MRAAFEVCALYTESRRVGGGVAEQRRQFPESRTLDPVGSERPTRILHGPALAKELGRRTTLRGLVGQLVRGNEKPIDLSGPLVGTKVATFYQQEGSTTWTSSPPEDPRLIRHRHPDGYHSGRIPDGYHSGRIPDGFHERSVRTTILQKLGSNTHGSPEPIPQLDDDQPSVDDVTIFPIDTIH